jgi:hypothetical protein
MHHHTDTSRLKQVIADIESLDLEPVKFKISSKEEGYGWTSEHTDRIELAYRRFMMLRAMHPQLQLAPTRDIDAFWHAHILDTRKYAEDCQHIFGEFIHHFPYLGLLGDEDKLENAATSLRELFVSEFGEDVPDNNHRGVAGDTAAAFCGINASADKSAAFCGVQVAGPTVSPASGVKPVLTPIANACQPTH